MSLKFPSPGFTITINPKHNFLENYAIPHRFYYSLFSFSIRRSFFHFFFVIFFPFLSLFSIHFFLQNSIRSPIDFISLFFLSLSADLFFHFSFVIFFFLSPLLYFFFLSLSLLDTHFLIEFFAIHHRFYYSLFSLSANYSIISLCYLALYLSLSLSSLYTFLYIAI